MKKMFAAMFTAFLMVALVSNVVVAKTPTSSGSLIPGQWKVYNGLPATKSFWDINKAGTATGGGLTFPIQQFLNKTTGSFAIYLLDSYNVDITGKTLQANATWTAGTYQTRSTAFPGAFARLEFQDTTSGAYTSNDYWWYSGSSLDLNAATGGQLTASLTDRAGWSNVCGQFATDTTAHPGTNCVNGTDPAVSPYAGFTNAMKNVKLVGLSFGSSSSYASGVAMDDTTGAFTVSSFLTQPLVGVSYYTASGDATFNTAGAFCRSAAPRASVVLTGGGTASQSVNTSGAVTLTTAGVTTYADNGFYVAVGTLGALAASGYTVTASGTPVATNVYFDTSGDGTFFTWDANGCLTSLNGDTYASMGSTTVTGTTSMYVLSGLAAGTSTYTLSQLATGAVAGFTSTTPVAVWVGFVGNGLATITAAP